VPALIFISTAHMIEQRPFWSDLVVTPIQAARLERLDLRAFGFDDFRFAAGPAAARWDDVERVLVALKRAGNPEHPRVAAVLDHLGAQYAAELAEHLPRFRPLTSAEAAELAADPRIRLGAHGHDHVILTYLDDAALDRNLTEPRRHLEALGAAPVTDLAYPNGDHDRRVVTRAAAAGYRRAWTTQLGLVHVDDDPFTLARILIGAFDPPWLLRMHINRLLLT
jgi:hypothetical protein